MVGIVFSLEVKGHWSHFIRFFYIIFYQSVFLNDKYAASRYKRNVLIQCPAEIKIYSFNQITSNLESGVFPLILDMFPLILDMYPHFLRLAPPTIAMRVTVCISKYPPPWFAVYPYWQCESTYFVFYLCNYVDPLWQYNIHIHKTQHTPQN